MSYYYAVLRQDSHIRIGYPIHHFRGREPRLGVSRETIRRLAIAGTLPHTVVCRGTRKTTRRFPRRFADDFAASGLDVADLAAFADAWRARITAPAR